MHRSRFFAVLLALALPSLAFADPKDDARRHFLDGLQAAQAGQYEVALQHFLAAQEAYPHPSTLYNIARTYQDLDDLGNALTYYRLFADASPDKAADVQPVIAVIEARLHQEQAPTPLPAPTTSNVTVAGVPPEVIQRLQALAAEMQAKVDEVNALTTAIADGSAAVADATPAVVSPPVDATPAPALPELPAGGLIQDAYQRIVVTASRYGQEPIDSPSAVTVLTDDDIRLSGATSIPELLRQVVGVDVMSLASGQSDVGIRGFNREMNNKVLILVDGRSTYLDFFGSTMWQTVTPALEEIERIEIIRGPGSAVYGANAVTGVVNIITRTPGEGGNLVHVQGGTADYGTGTLLASGRDGATSYRLSAGYDQVGRWAKEVSPDTTSLTFALPDQNLGQRTLRANARVDRTFGSDGFASVSGGYSQGIAEFYNIGALGDFYLQQRSGTLRADAAKGPVHLRAFWNTLNGEAGAWAAPVDALRSLGSSVQADVVDVELEGNEEFATGSLHHHLNAGIGYRYKRTDMPGFIPFVVQENHASIFANEEATLGKLKVVASLRADRHPLLPLSQTISPRGAAIVRVAPHTSVRVTGGTAFRAPNQLENYMQWTLPTTNDLAYVRDYGSKTLRPERIVTGEIGVHDESTNYHTADLGLYVNKVTDIIYLSDVAPPTAADLAYNDDQIGYLAGTTGWTNLPERYLGYGAELEVNLFPVDGLDVYGNADLQRVAVTSPDGTTVLDKSASAVKLNAGVMYRTHYRTDVALHASYSSAQTWGLRNFDSAGQLQVVDESVPARLVISSKIATRPFKDNDLELAVGVWNLGAMLGDVNTPGVIGPAREHPKGQPVGSRLYGSVEYKF